MRDGRTGSTRLPSRARPFLARKLDRCYISFYRDEVQKASLSETKTASEADHHTISTQGNRPRRRRGIASSRLSRNSPAARRNYLKVFAVVIGLLIIATIGSLLPRCPASAIRSTLPRARSAVRGPLSAVRGARHAGSPSTNAKATSGRVGVEIRTDLPNPFTASINTPPSHPHRRHLDHHRPTRNVAGSLDTPCR